MMEVRFACVYMDSEAGLRELYKMMCRPNRKWIILYAVLIGICGMAWLAGGKNSNLILIAAYLALMTELLTRPYRRAKKNHRERLRQFNGTLPESRIQFGDQIRYRDGEIETIWPYHTVKHIYLMKNSIALENHSRMLLQFPKNNFTKGTPSELLVFLKVQCPQLNIPDWKW